MIQNVPIKIISTVPNCTLCGFKMMTDDEINVDDAPLG